MFRLRELWHTAKLTPDEYSPDAIALFSLSTTTYIVTGGFSGILRFFYPQKADGGLPVTEIKLKAPILQLSYGTFIEADQNALAVLHPNLLVLYKVYVRDRTIVCDELQSFVLSHHAFNFIPTQIDSLTAPPSIAVQSLDGELTICGSHGSSTYQIPHFFLPGQFVYIPLLESFIFASSDYRVSCYRRNAVFSRHNGDPPAEWTFVCGEAVVAIKYWKTSSRRAGSSNFEIAIIGERTLFVLNDSGKLKTSIKHNGSCMCAHSYISTPSTKRTCNNLIVGCYDKTLSIFINFKKVWQLSLPFIPIAMTVADIEPNKGIIVAMDATGEIVAGYLGTHDNSSLGLPALPQITDEQLSAHMEKISKKMEEMPTADHLQLFVNISRASPEILELVFQPSGSPINDVRCFVDLPLSIERVPEITVGKLEEKEQTFRISLKPTNCSPAPLSVILNATFSTQEERVLSKSVMFEVPYELFIKRVEARVKGAFSLTVSAHGDFVTLATIFSNLGIQGKHSFSFILANGDTVSISEDSKNKRYRLEADSFDRVGFILNVLLKNLEMAQKSQKGGSSSSSHPPLYIKGHIHIEEFQKIVVDHYKLRAKERELKKKTHLAVTELESVQKALITRYEATTPKPLDDLNDLLANNIATLKDYTKQIQETQEEIKFMDGRIEAGVFTLMLMFKCAFNPDKSKMELIKNSIPTRCQDCTPGWEECAYAGLSYAIEKLTGTKQNAAFGGEVEFLSSVDVLTDLFSKLHDELKKGSE